MEKRASALGYLRKKAKLTQQKVADEIGVDQTAISHIILSN